MALGPSSLDGWRKITFPVILDRLRVTATGYAATVEEYGTSAPETALALTDLKDACNHLYAHEYPHPKDGDGDLIARTAPDKPAKDLLKLRANKVAEQALLGS